MHAVAIPEFGADPQLMDLPVPQPGPGEVLVAVRAAGFNPFDLKVVEHPGAAEFHFPLILGTDGAGTVEAVGPGVTSFRPGDDVYGEFLHTDRGLGSYAEHALAAEDGPVAPMPKGMIFEQAAAVPRASATALSLVRTATIDAGHAVLIVGATGGVGQSATQLADLQGAHVIVTATASEAALMRDLGADEIIDYTAGPVADQVLAEHPDGIDTIIDLVTGPAAIQPLTGMLRPGGVILSTIGALQPDELAAREIRGENFGVRPSHELLADLADLIDAGRLKVHIETQVPLAEVPDVLAGKRRTSARGKTVITIGT